MVALGARLLQLRGGPEGELQRLVGVEARIAGGVIALRQHVVGDGLGAAGAFGEGVGGGDGGACGPPAPLLHRAAAMRGVWEPWARASFRLWGVRKACSSAWLGLRRGSQAV